MTDELQHFIETDAVRYRAAALATVQDPLIFAGIKNWDISNDHDKTAFLERYVRVTARHLGTNAPDVEIFRKPPLHGLAENGHYDQEPGFKGTGTIRLNFDPAVMNLAKLLDTVPHELAHGAQKEITRDPQRIAARYRATVPALFEGNFKNYLSPKTDADFAAYQRQPLEDHAIAMGKAFAQTVHDYAARHTLVPNTYSEKTIEREFDILNARLLGGRISFPTSNGIAAADPYRHYYTAKLAEERLGVHNGPENWREICVHYKQALTCAEFMPYDPRPALEGLGRLARDEVWIDRAGQPARHVETPPQIIKLAQDSLGRFARSKNADFGASARLQIAKGERHAVRPGPRVAPGKKYQAG